MTINEIVKKARKESGMSMADVAKECGVPTSTICRYEKKLHTVSLSYVRYWILKGLNINWEELEIDD